MSKPITTAEAAIQTSTVAVKTICVNNRQMTLSVFRQLPEAHAFEYNTESDIWLWRGIPWGTVNYFWKDCCTAFLGRVEPKYQNQYAHLHVVWQNGNELCRFGFFEEDVRFGAKGYEAWKARFQEATQLDQLFIAV